MVKLTESLVQGLRSQMSQSSKLLCISIYLKLF